MYVYIYKKIIIFIVQNPVLKMVFKHKMNYFQCHARVFGYSAATFRCSTRLPLSF